jgi:hypothetical protein
MMLGQQLLVQYRLFTEYYISNYMVNIRNSSVCTYILYIFGILEINHMPINGRIADAIIII